MLQFLFSPTKQFKYESGKLLDAGKIYVYYKDTTNLATLYNIDGDYVSNPIILDANGRASVKADDTYEYRLEVYTNKDVLLFTCNAFYAGDGTGGEGSFIVRHDETLSGNGTSQSLLGVVTIPIAVDETMTARIDNVSGEDALVLGVESDWFNETFSGALSGKVDTSTFEECCSSVSAAVDGKLDKSDYDSDMLNYYTKPETDSLLSAKTDNTNFISFTQYVDNNKQDNLSFDYDGYSAISSINGSAIVGSLGETVPWITAWKSLSDTTTFLQLGDIFTSMSSIDVSGFKNHAIGNKGGVYQLPTVYDVISSLNNVGASFTNVIHDTSLSGNGTVDSPLSVANVVKQTFNNTMSVQSGDNSYTAGVNVDWLNDNYYNKTETITANPFPMTSNDGTYNYTANCIGSGLSLARTNGANGSSVKIESTGVTFFKNNNTTSKNWEEILGGGGSLDGYVPYSATELGIGIDNGVTGGWSLAIGSGNTANTGISLGLKNEVTGYGVGIGQINTAHGSVAIGRYNNAAIRSVALGMNASANTDSFAILQNASAYDSSIAIGYSARAEKDSIAIGDKASAYYGAIALGENSTAANHSIAINGHAVASHCIAIDGYAMDPMCISVGFRSRAENSGIAVGTDLRAGSGTMVFGSFNYAPNSANGGWIFANGKWGTTADIWDEAWITPYGGISARRSMSGLDYVFATGGNTGINSGNSANLRSLYSTVKTYSSTWGGGSLFPITANEDSIGYTADCNASSLTLFSASDNLYGNVQFTPTYLEFNSYPLNSNSARWSDVIEVANRNAPKPVVSAYNFYYTSNTAQRFYSFYWNQTSGLKVIDVTAPYYTNDPNHSYHYSAYFYDEDGLIGHQELANGETVKFVKTLDVTADKERWFYVRQDQYGKYELKLVGE